MLLSLHPFRCTFLVCLALLGGPLAAQAQAAAAHIDPRARALLTTAIAAHNALPGLAGTVVVHGSGNGSDLNQTLTFSFRKPQSARMAIADGTGPLVQFVSDGHSLTIYDVQQKFYKKEQLRPGAPIIFGVLSQCGALLPRLFARPASLARFLAAPGASASLGAPTVIGGTPTDTVHLTLPDLNGPTTLLTFSLGHRDHLLRRLTQLQTGFSDGQMHTVSQSETMTRLEATPPRLAAAFVFSPPPGVHKYTEYDPRLVVGARPFAFAAKDLTGKPISLAQYRGKVVLMDFWATWCPPCVGEMPDIRAAYQKYHGRGFDVVGLSLDESHGALTSYVRQNKMPWRQVFGGRKFESAIPRQYGVIAIPFNLLIGRDGKIRTVALHGPELMAAINQAVAQK